MSDLHLRVKLVAFRDAGPDFLDRSKKRLADLFPGLYFSFVDGEADLLFFASGGSEREAVDSLDKERYCLLLADRYDNAYAAATEVMAWVNRNGFSASLYSIDRAGKEGIMPLYARALEARKALTGQKAALVGNISHWLVASSVPVETFKKVLGIELLQLDWDVLPDVLSMPAHKEFLETFTGQMEKGLEAEARIHGFLKHIIREHNLQGVSPECFTMVKERDVTACLSLALLNSQGIAAACEGDLVSLAGMMVMKALTGRIPWMANVAMVEENRVLFAHCTAGLDLVDNASYPTHFETDRSAALRAEIQMEEVTVFRFSQDLDSAFVSEGKVIGRPGHHFACRTQVEVDLPETALFRLRDAPLGNHHLLIPGRQKALIDCFLRLLQPPGA